MARGIEARTYKWIRGDRATKIDGSPVMLYPGKIWYVDGDLALSGAGNTWTSAKKTIQAAVTAAASGDTILVRARAMATAATDPVDYAETIIIPPATDRLSIIGVSRGRAQGNLPQIKKGSGSTALLTIRSPGCYIANLGFNGASATGGGIRVESDASTKDAFGTVIESCHFKNCKGSTATNAATGGAIQLSGAPWQIHIKGNRFYKNVGGIVLLDTANSVPQDVVIEDNSFGDSAASVDCDIYLKGGSGPGIGLLIRGNDFGTLPALASGTNVRFVDLTGADGGLFANNYFGTDGTWGAAGNAGIVPTTVFLSGNYDEGGLIARV